MKTKQPARVMPLSATGTLFFAALVLILSACHKDVQSDAAQDPVLNPADTVAAKTTAELTQSVPFPQNVSPGCTYAPDYGQTLIQPQPVSGSDYIVSPVNNKDIAGTYLAWPGGLVIDAKTGAIDVTKSETGARYAIGFVRTGSEDTCLSYITLGGADYIDSVYSASVSSKTAAPHFNANLAGPSPCAGSKCKFDYNEYAKKQGVYVDGHNGSIDIKNTLQHSLFALLPIDGMYFYSTIQYKVNDASNNAPQSIQVKFIYYNNRSSIPASLLQTVSARAEGISTGTLVAAGVTRPPIIIITRAQ